MSKLRLWSIQSFEAWENLKKQGFLIGSKEFAETCFLEGYNWMRKKMKERLGPPCNPNQYPLWAWLQYSDKNHKKPDLRRSGHLPRNTPGVRIEFFKDESEVLLSDFDLWHQPLYYKRYIGDNEVDSINFDKQIEEGRLKDIEYFELPVETKKMIEDSWEKLFDLEFNDNYYTTSIDEKMIQATFWQLNLEDIVSVDHFVAR